mmetsp:Transcript_30010/g.38524  ORF Transcript_30010/g.38524 Transcript_30010/m.38524 type:complete len:208 (+) Transcript_30010:929-1552(+)
MQSSSVLPVCNPNFMMDVRMCMSIIFVFAFATLLYLWQILKDYKEELLDNDQPVLLILMTRKMNYVAIKIRKSRLSERKKISKLRWTSRDLKFNNYIHKVQRAPIPNSSGVSLEQAGLCQMKLFPTEDSVHADEEKFPFLTEDRPQNSLAWQQWQEYYAKALFLSGSYPYQRSRGQRTRDYELQQKMVYIGFDFVEDKIFVPNDIVS